MHDRPSPLFVIMLAVIFFLVAALCFILTPDTGSAQADYRYANCGNVLLRTYDGDDGYVRWGQPIMSNPGGWTDYQLPLVGKARLMSLTSCRIIVRDAADILWLDFDGVKWGLPGVGYTTYLPLARR